MNGNGQECPNCLTSLTIASEHFGSLARGHTEQGKDHLRVLLPPVDAHALDIKTQLENSSLVYPKGRTALVVSPALSHLHSD
jgi:hypothetical protein